MKIIQIKSAILIKVSQEIKRIKMSVCKRQEGDADSRSATHTQTCKQTHIYKSTKISMHH